MRWSWGRWWQLRHTSRPRIANEPPSFRGFGGFCCLPDRLVSCRRLLGPKIEKRHRRLAARSGGAGAAAGSVPRCASLKLFWMSSKVPAPGRVAGGDGSRLLNAPPIATAPTRAAACGRSAGSLGTAPSRNRARVQAGRTPREHSGECVGRYVGWLLVFQPPGRLSNRSRAMTSASPAMHACRFCGSSHASKTKLFNHLRESYACAAAAVAENPDAATSLCRPMSRARHSAGQSRPRSWLAEAGWSLGPPECALRLQEASGPSAGRGLSRLSFGP